MNSTLTKTSLLAMALLVGSALPAEAQLGGLGRRAREAAERAARGDDPRQQKVVYNEHVLEMTGEVVTRLEAGLVAEDAKRQEIVRLAAAVRTPEAHQQCVMELMASPDGQKAVNDMTAKAQVRMDKPGDKAAMDAYVKSQQAMTQLMRERCGPDPDEFETERRNLQSGLGRIGVEASGFTPTQYAILKERITPLCTMAQKSADGAVRIPGDGKNIYWVYSAEEVEVLLPRCAELSGLLPAAK